MKEYTGLQKIKEAFSLLERGQIIQLRLHNILHPLRTYEVTSSKYRPHSGYFFTRLPEKQMISVDIDEVQKIRILTKEEGIREVAFLKL